MRFQHSIHSELSHCLAQAKGWEFRDRLGVVPAFMGLVVWRQRNMSLMAADLNVEPRCG